MLASQQSLPLSSYSGLYDLIIPKDNILRKINDLIDFFSYMMSLLLSIA